MLLFEGDYFLVHFQLAGYTAWVLLNSGLPRALLLSVHTLGRRRLLKFLQTGDLSQGAVTQLLTHQTRTEENKVGQVRSPYLPTDRHESLQEQFVWHEPAYLLILA